jgi:TATA-box binding protein (TBP) (component of TFIID and TFIIIB)
MTELETEVIFYNNLSKCKTDDKIATKLVVAVMTVCGTLGSPIDLLEIFDYYMDVGCESFELSYVPNSKKSRGNETGKKNTAFYNCLNVTFYYKDIDSVESKIAAKVFPNGSIQLPGCKTIDTVHRAPEILHNFINDIAKECKEKNPEINVIKNLDIFALKNVRIVMINSNFSFEKGILQERLKIIINNFKFEGKENPEHVWRMASFQPEKYSGLNSRYMTKRCRDSTTTLYLEGKKIPMKLDGQVSVFIFRSGKGTITGAKNTKDLLETYQAITDLVRKEKKQVFYNPK